MFQIFKLFLADMEQTEQLGRIEHFLQEVVVDELGKLQGIGLSYMHFVLMGQAIEVLGGFLDQKPLKAKDQSCKRFSLSVNKLFGGRYRLLNSNNGLYNKLRNQMTHTFIPGNELLLLNRDQNKEGYTHLEERNGCLILIAEDFYEDICRASERLLQAIREGRLKAKTISF